jgi:hypothetical protein
MESPLLGSGLQFPTSEELPCSDNPPVDDENQGTI